MNQEKFVNSLLELFPRVMRHLEEQEAREVTGLDVTPAQVHALLALNAKNNLTMGELAAELSMAESAATRLADRLARTNLIRRRGDPRDRRLVRIGLSSYGQQLAQLVIQRRTRTFGYLAEHLTPVEQENLVQSMQGLLRSWAEIEAEAREREGEQKEM
ncbi:MAG: MarR family transcriptional regulator [Firmicutes bacterium]|nr:MarR family transcriptional regulator [Bacillota bacterium]